MSLPALWIEEPDYAARYGRGVSRGIEVGYKTRGQGTMGFESETSPAYHRGLKSGYETTLRVLGIRG